MVDRTTAQGLDEFVGTAKSVAFEEGKFGPQYHIELEPEDKEIIKGPTGSFHVWLRVSAKATDSTVPEGSVLDGYLRAVERLFREAKSAATVKEALDCLVGKKILYTREKLGRSFKEHEASEQWVPNKLVR
jgi:hypothetical protein